LGRSTTSGKPGDEAATTAEVTAVNKDTQELDKSGCEAVTDSDEKAAADCPEVKTKTMKTNENKTMNDCVVVHVHNVQD